MNQKSIEKATFLVECDFYKLLSNASFGIDCTNDIENHMFEPIYNKISKIA